MSDADFSATLRWPNVPACYGWLSLDRRGQWRLRGETVTHHGLISFLNRHYTHDAIGNCFGNYFVQNGPQRVFVELDYTPWVLWLASGSAQQFSLQTHTGEPVDEIHQAVLDEEGNLLLETPLGIALLCDRDLPALLNCLRHADGALADDDALLAVLEQPSGSSSELTLHWRDQRIPVTFTQRNQVAERFGFIASPQSAAPQDSLQV